MNFKLPVTNKKRTMIIIAVIIFIIIFCLCIFFFSKNQTVAKKAENQTVVANQQSDDSKQEQDTATIKSDNNSSQNQESSNDSASKTKETNKDTQTKTSKKNSQTQSTSKSSQKTTTNKSSSTNQSSSSTHEHVWKDHTAKRQVTKTVTVVDEPETSQKVPTYRLYWWDSKKWTETTDPEVFKEWSAQKMQWMKTTGYTNPPELYLGKDANGHDQYTNDHSIITNYETVPAKTHQEEKTYTETYVDYQYCSICGAKK